MEPTREIKKDGYIYILNTNKRQYRCATCSSTFTIDSYSSKSGHSNKCRKSKSDKKSAKKTIENPSLFLNKEDNRKLLQVGTPIRIPTKHFKKEKTPTESNASDEEDRNSITDEVEDEEEVPNISIPDPIQVQQDIKRDIEEQMQRIKKSKMKLVNKRKEVAAPKKFPKLKK